jgi:hypothetical protein
MAVPIALAGAGIAARGFASYMAKKKAKEAAMKAGYGSVPAATMPNLVTTSKSINPVAGTAGLVASGVAGYGVGEYQNGLKSLSKNKGNYGMVGPMTEYRSQDPSYDASMTREGQIQTMMEEMDGMNISEEAKRQIIADKLGVMIGGNNADYGGPLSSVEKKKIQDDIDEMKKEFARRNTVDYRRYGASPESIEAMEKKDNEELKRRMMNGFRSGTGAGVTSNEMKMFMGMPRR